MPGSSIELATTRKRRIAFQEKTVVHAYCDTFLTREQRKFACWYSNAELEECRLDAKLSIKLLVHFNGDISRIDQSKVEVRGLEKYGSGDLQEMKRKKVVVRSVLKQQQYLRANQKATTATLPKERFSAISCTLSQPSVILARKLASSSSERVLSCDCWKEELPFFDEESSIPMISDEDREPGTTDTDRKRKVLSRPSSDNKRICIMATGS
jgi:hypothetical protein